MVERSFDAETQWILPRLRVTSEPETSCLLTVGTAAPVDKWEVTVQPGHREPGKVQVLHAGRESPVSCSLKSPQHQHTPPPVSHTHPLCWLLSCPGRELRLREGKQLGKLPTGLLRAFDEMMFVKQIL